MSSERTMGVTNGIDISSDGNTLYVSESKTREIWAYRIDGAKLAAPRLVEKFDGPPDSELDGLRTDIDGNVWCSMGWADPKEDGVRCYAPSGDLIGKIHLPETCANLCFGGPKRNRLFMCGSASVYATYVETQGALLP